MNSLDKINKKNDYMLIIKKRRESKHPIFLEKI
jgi:hypothetical protein